MNGQYVINEALKSQYAGLYVLYEMEHSQEKFFVELNNEHQFLSPLFTWLLKLEYVKITQNNQYVLTQKGRDVLENFVDRYQQFLKEFDIYCAVDLEEGDFAFRYYDDFHDQDAWQEFILEERWEDLRIAVAEFKGWDTIEIIFMSFINEGSFGRDEFGNWSYNLLLGKIWDEIQSIANTAVRMKSLAYQDEGVIIPAEEVIKDILNQGEELLNEIQ